MVRRWSKETVESSSNCQSNWSGRKAGNRQNREQSTDVPSVAPCLWGPIVDDLINIHATREMHWQNARRASDRFLIAAIAAIAFLVCKNWLLDGEGQEFTSTLYTLAMIGALVAAGLYHCIVRLEIRACDVMDKRYKAAIDLAVKTEEIKNGE